ncbi:MAG: YjbH domain-containing protein [Syntrophales bacterium]
MPSRSLGADGPFTGAANWGGTGLMAVPTARLMKEGTFRIGASQVHPYRCYYGAVSPLKGLEIDGRITEVIGVRGFADSPEYGSYKDKALDVKYRLLPETKYLPALALGLMDPHGTRLYSSQYLVASKQIYPFDFTFGYANGRYGKQELADVGSGDSVKAEILTDPGQWWSEANWFWGIEFSPLQWLSLMIEYDPTPYHTHRRDPASSAFFSRAVPSKFNYGLRIRPREWIEAVLSYQRGDTIGVNLNFTFDLGRPLLPIVDPPLRESMEMRSSPLRERLTAALFQAGFRDIGILEVDGELWIQADNRIHYYDMKALGVILRIVDQVAPPEIRGVHVLLTRLGIPMTSFSTTRGDIRLHAAKRLSLDEFLQVSELRADIQEPLKTETKHRMYFDYGLKPDFRTYLNDPSGFFQYRFGLSGWVALSPWRGGTLLVATEMFPFSTISSPVTPSSNAVRTDLVDYIGEKAGLSSLLVSQIWKGENETYSRLSAGLLEIQYAGIDAEIARPLFAGRLIVGAGGSVVRKRDPKNPFRFRENDYKDSYTTGFFNARLNIPELDAMIDVKAGRFLAGDNGVRMTVSKTFHGVVLSAWYSISDTSVFTDSYNRGYHDKGIAVSIPMRLFLGRDSKSSYHFTLSPWTRDVAQDIAHPESLFDFIGRSVKAFMEADRHMIH